MPHRCGVIHFIYFHLATLTHTTFAIAIAPSEHTIHMPHHCHLTTLTHATFAVAPSEHASTHYIDVASFTSFTFILPPSPTPPSLSLLASTPHAHSARLRLLAYLSATYIINKIALLIKLHSQ